MYKTFSVVTSRPVLLCSPQGTLGFSIGSQGTEVTGMCQKPQGQLLSSGLLPPPHSPLLFRPSLGPLPSITLQGLDRGFTDALGIWSPPPRPTPSVHFQTQELFIDQEAPVAAQPLKYYIWENPRETNKFRDRGHSPFTLTQEMKECFVSPFSTVSFPVPSLLDS
uniref:Uncharacterized protein n=1 Tax=Molossus molossus TaxID=27622 RepID=A0A7J8JW73_MOLMO|nr:hypothetical protein HJG59_008005 [Molossus molossus]